MKIKEINPVNPANHINPGIFTKYTEKGRETGQLFPQAPKQGVLPPKKLYEALHVAFCTVHHVDCLVSWNFRHLANINRERKILVLNLAQGYTHPLRITTPLELTGDE